MPAKTIKSLLALIPLLAIILIVGFIFKDHPKPKPESLGATTQNTYPTYSFNEKLFYENVKRSSTQSPIKQKIRGGVVPHHDLAGFMLAHFFQNLSKQNPSKIIILGPNHKDLGQGKALTTTYNFETPFGLLETDTKAVESLAQNSLIKLDNSVFEDEQSIGTLTPFVKHYLPKTLIVPIILKSSFQLEDAQSLSKTLKPLLDENTVIIASVDFSHYLTSQQAQQKDAQTLILMESKNFPELFSLSGSDYLDSPAAIATLFLTQDQDFKIIDHTNSGILNQSPAAPTTSYFELIF